MPGTIEIQLTFHQDAYPCATRALRRFGTARNRADYLKTVLEAHFKTLEGAQHRTVQENPGPTPPHADKQSSELPESLDTQDIQRTFSSFFK
ncbi:hypothetical protein SAMD00023378_2771 [Ralstonia sp. NT80]|nr:hypothetical protein SAMD00023378_2771 [Ralstonia sp. NT80]